MWSNMSGGRCGAVFAREQINLQPVSKLSAGKERRTYICIYIYIYMYIDIYIYYIHIYIYYIYIYIYIYIIDAFIRCISICLRGVRGRARAWAKETEKYGGGGRGGGGGDLWEGLPLACSQGLSKSVDVLVMTSLRCFLMTLSERTLWNLGQPQFFFRQTRSIDKGKKKSGQSVKKFGVKGCCVCVYFGEKRQTTSFELLKKMQIWAVKKKIPKKWKDRQPGLSCSKKSCWMPLRRGMTLFTSLFSLAVSSIQSADTYIGVWGHMYSSKRRGRCHAPIFFFNLRTHI